MLDFAMSSYLLFSISDFDIYCVILITKSENCAANDLAKKKKMIIIIKDFIKQPVIKQIPFFFSVFLFSVAALWVFFSFLIKASVNFEKLIRFHRQAI